MSCQFLAPSLCGQVCNHPGLSYPQLLGWAGVGEQLAPTCGKLLVLVKLHNQADLQACARTVTPSPCTGCAGVHPSRVKLPAAAGLGGNWEQLPLTCGKLLMLDRMLGKQHNQADLQACAQPVMSASHPKLTYAGVQPSRAELPAAARLGAEQLIPPAACGAEEM